MQVGSVLHFESFMGPCQLSSMIIKVGGGVSIMDTPLPKGVANAQVP